MTAYVLCPGPSLASHPDAKLRAAPIRIGVNRAVHRVTCTHWCFADDLQYDPSRRPPHPIHVFTSEHVLHLIDQSKWQRPRHLTTFESLFERYPQNISDERGAVAWPTYSATAAIVCAAALGATTIRVFGADWTEEPDWDGVNLPENRRGPDRWRDERLIWDRVVEHLATRERTPALVIRQPPPAAQETPC